MGRRKEDRDQEEADGLLDEWGWHRELVQKGLFPGASENEAEQYGVRLDRHGHSDPTFNTVAKRAHLLAIEKAFQAIHKPQHRQRILEQYVYRLDQETAAESAGISCRAWRDQRDDAREVFIALYHHRRQIATDTTCSSGKKGKSQEVVGNG